MEKGELILYKLAQPDGFDFYTGKTINYRDNIGKTVKCPTASDDPQLCTDTVIHASVDVVNCFIGAQIPCSVYKVRGVPVCKDSWKCGLTEMYVIEELDPVKLFEWNYTEVADPVNPFKLPKRKPTDDDIALLKEWAALPFYLDVFGTTRKSIEKATSIGLWAAVWGSIAINAGYRVRDKISYQLPGHMRYAYVWDVMGAYIGSLFTNVVDKWIGIDHDTGIYPYQAAATLWRRGLVPSLDGITCQLHSGEKANTVWKGVI